MVQVKGHYKHERNENLDEYFSEMGIPYIARKMMSMSNPTVIISENEDGIWTIGTKTLVRSSEIKFKLGEEYDETMPSGGVVLKNVTTLSGDKLETVSQSNTGVKTIRTYTFTEHGMVLTLVNEQSGRTAKRYFKRM